MVGIPAVVLIIEDDEELRHISAKMLDMAGYQTFEAGTRDEAIEIIAKNNCINTLLLDLTMPGMSVDDFLRKIKNRLNNMKVIFSSGQTRDILDNFIGTSENYLFLSKPYGLNDLQVALHENTSEI